MKKPTAGNITTIAEAREASTLAFNKKQYGDLIHAQRTHLGLSQAQLAQKLGVQKAYVTHWEAGPFTSGPQPDPHPLQRTGHQHCGFLQRSGQRRQPV